MQALEFPIDVQNEQVILGQALNFADQRELFLVKSDWNFFQERKHRVIAWCIMTMVRREIEPEDDSFTLVANDFPDQDRAYGGNRYLSTIRKLCPSSTVNYDAHLIKLENDHVKARIASQAIMRTMVACANPHTSLDELESQLESTKAAIAEHRPVEIDFAHGENLYDDYMSLMRMRTDTELGTFVPTGYSDLDDLLTEGMTKQKVSIIAGFTGMAKSAFSTNCMNLQVGSGLRVGKCSLEMPKESELDRLISIMTGIPITNIAKETFRLPDERKRQIDMVAKGIRDTDLIFINDRATQNLRSIDTQLSLLRRSGIPLDVLYIDLFGKLDDVSVVDGLATNIEQKLRITRELARRHKVHICVISQIRRYFDLNTLRPNKPVPRPKLDKIKNSNAYAEEADLVLLLHRDKYYKPELEHDILEVYVAKQRQGEAGGCAFFEFDGPCTSIASTNLRPADWDAEEGV